MESTGSFQLVIGSKNLSSWSLRAWLAMKQVGVEFDEIIIQLDQPTTQETILQYSPSGRVPALHHEGSIVWDSLAICEYLAELFPRAMLWPEDRHARARARSYSAEMHSGFLPLRKHLPMNFISKDLSYTATEEVQEDIARIQAIWSTCRLNHQDQGKWLFGTYSIADIMFAPVVSRFISYGVDVDSLCKEYIQTVWQHPFMQEWYAAAK